MLFKVESIRPDRDYELGVTWWDFDGGGRSESIQVENSAGSEVTPLVTGYKLPIYFNPRSKTGRRGLPVSLVFKIPKKVYVNGSFQVRIVRAGGSNAVLSEMWVADQKP
jgi:hypothetical protein